MTSQIILSSTVVLIKALNSLPLDPFTSVQFSQSAHDWVMVYYSSDHRPLSAEDKVCFSTHTQFSCQVAPSLLIFTDA